MSTTIDEKVVEMRFDNKQFESNVQSSMSTLDKLKQKLNLSGASKGLEDINSATKKVDMSSLGDSVESVRMKFSALQVMGVTALANITNSAVNTGKRIVDALTLAPVRDGFNEYETQMNAVQTILANTQKEGTTVKIVNNALDELNTYADKTIYNFTEMTRNIGTFTAAGVKLDSSVSAIKGIANLAAVSGSTSQQASTAMYQLSQALAAGKVQLMDWNSVVNAGMGGQVFQDALIRTSEHLKTGAKDAIKANGSFRESLTKSGWLTTEVLTQTLDQFATVADTQKEYQAAIKKFVGQGYTKEEAKQMADMARTAGNAATKVKTFTQLIDTLKEALGSGWTKTWQLVIGDFEEAKALWTKVSDVLSGFINDFSDARNKLLESALGKGFGDISKNISSIIKPAKKAMTTVDDTVKVVSKLGNVVDDVILGKFGYGKERFDALTKAGQNYYKVQNKVNEKLGNSFRYTDEQIKAQDKLLGVQDENIKKTKEETTKTEKLTKDKKELIKKIANMSEEQMRSNGYSDKQIETFKKLGATADKLGMPLNEFIDNMDKINGRWLLLHSFENIGASIIKAFKAIGNAWKETFKAMSANDLFNIIAGFHKFTQSIKLTNKDADKLKRTFKGIFAILDIITTITGGGLKIAFKALSVILGAFNLNILDVTASIGDLIVKFRDFLFGNKLKNTNNVATKVKTFAQFIATLTEALDSKMTKALKTMADNVKMAVKAFKSFIDTIKKIPKVQKFIEKLKNIDFLEIGNNIIKGLNNGLEGGMASVSKILTKIGKIILDTIKSVLGIHSPSTEMYSIGEYSILGLVNGLKDGTKKVWNVISGLGSKILGWIKGFEWNKAFSAGISVALVVMLKKLVNIIDSFASPVAGLGDLLSGVGEVLSTSAKSINKVIKNTAKVIKSFSKVLNAKAFQMKAEAIRNLAISLAILAGAVFLLAQLDTTKLWSSIGAITVLAGILVALAFAMDKLTNATATIDKNGFNLKGLKTGLIAIGAALLLIAATVKIMGSMDPETAKRGFLGLAGIIAAIGAVFLAYGKFVTGDGAQNIDKAGKMLRKMATTLLLLVVVVKLAGTLSPAEMLKGAAFAGAFIIFVGALTAISCFSTKNIDQIGSMILKLTIAMGLMVGVVKLVSGLSPAEMLKGAAFAGAFLIFVAAIVGITTIGGEDKIAKIGGLLLSISFSMLLMVGVVKLVGMLSVEEMKKGATFVGAFLIFLAAIIGITKIGKEDQIAKVTGTILAMSVAIGIMAGVCLILGLIDLGSLAKGVVAVSTLGAILALMIASTKGAEDVKGNILAMSVAIGVMAIAVAALSFIDSSKLAGATAALSVLMGMFALMAKSAGSLNGSMNSLIIMTIAVGLLGGILYLLSTLPIESVLSASASLSMLLLSLSASMLIISKAGSVTPMALVCLGVMTLVVAALAGILYLMSGLPVESTLAVAKSLSMLLLALSACCVILSVVGLAGPAALIGIGSLIALITAIGALMAAIGALTTYFPQLEEFLDKGIVILEKIGTGLGSFFGNIISGFASSVMDIFPKLGLSLGQFMINATPFILGAKMIDSSMMAGVKSLAECILILTGANILESLTSWFTGGSSLADFGSEIAAFGPYLAQFAASVSGIDGKSVKAAASAAKALAEMTATIPNEGGVVGWFAGENSIAKFASELPILGLGLMMFSSSVSGIDVKSIKAAAKAGKALTDMTATIPNEGGVVGWFAGENSVAKYGTELPTLGKGLSDFSDSVKDINPDNIKTASEAGKALTDMTNTIPKEGGLKAWFSGKSGVSKFAEQLPTLGKGLSDFSDSVKDVNPEKITAASKSGKALAEMSKVSPENTTKIKSFGENIVDFGSKVKKYFNAVKDVSAESINTASNAIQSISKISSSIKSDKIKSASNAISSMTKSMKMAMTVNEGSTDGIVESISRLGNSNVNKLLESYKDSYPKMTKAGQTMVIKFVQGLKDTDNKVSVAAEALAEKVKTGISTAKTSMKSVGQDLGDGLVKGINSKKQAVYDAGFGLGQKAVKGEKDGQKSNSPSKLTIQAGKWFGEGLVIGINKMGSDVYSAGYGIGNTAVKSMSNALSKVNDVMNIDADVQPTIRPVVDLSDVKTGVKAIDGMFGNGASIELMSNINSIKTSVNGRQNINGSDIVTAIDKLRSELNGNMGNTTYTINGITYDDGSNVSDAIQTLVKAARIERRV